MQDLRTAHLPAGLSLSESRLRLFDKAVELFGERGFHAVSMRDLAAELGIKGASLYAHVPSKQHLLYEVTSIGLTQHNERLKAAVLGAGSDPEEQMRALIREHVVVQLAFPALTRTCSNELRHLEEPLLARSVAIRDRTGQLFLDVVDRGARLGVFTVSNPGRAMRAVADMGIRSAEWPRPVGVDEQIAEDYAEYAVRVLR